MCPQTLRCIGRVLMASKIDACIFCDEIPCACNRPKRILARGANTRKADKVPVTDKSDIPDTSGLELRHAQPGKKSASFLDAMKNAAQNAPSLPAPPPREEKKAKARPPKPPEVIKAKPQIPEVPDDELVMNAAIRNLAPLLHWKEQERYAAIISSKPHPHERKAIWKMRRKDEQARQSDQRGNES